MKSASIAGFVLFGMASAASLPGDSYGDKKRACCPAEIALATGIHLNINGQYSEYNTTQKIEDAEKAHPSGPSTEIYELIGQLQANVQGGQNLRLFNQQIAPAGNPAIPGLAQYAAAEETEKSQADAVLNGNYAHDKPTLEMLKQEILKGITLNQNNLKAAVSECDFTLVFPPANEMGS
ncbi:hypothetical protein DOTSEDRAFT_122371 [Dothistroma septosporum NZE10]|uniref:Uncharacterized protein n=1 Tax=Dothistroma septosporum (strain NZE10 / CBS 128990) TaxID=675120 RepID=N1Q1R7_DOTSN|nr:hypothetical protein DOTSEDRAFT_122371 [Dothistroma septosporum NZE10]